MKKKLLLNSRCVEFNGQFLNWMQIVKLLSDTCISGRVPLQCCKQKSQNSADSVTRWLGCWPLGRLPAGPPWWSCWLLRWSTWTGPGVAERHLHTEHKDIYFAKKWDIWWNHEYLFKHWVNTSNSRLFTQTETFKYVSYGVR